LVLAAIAVVVGGAIATGQTPVNAAESSSVSHSAIPQAAVADTVAESQSLPPPDGLTLVGSRVDELSSDEAPESLTIVESKFHGPNRTAVTVLFVIGGRWDSQAEMAVGDERSAVEIMIGERHAVLVEGDLVRSVQWPREDGTIVQIVARGEMTAEELLSYAARIDGAGS